MSSKCGIAAVTLLTLVDFVDEVVVVYRPSKSQTLSKSTITTEQTLII